MKSTLWLLVIIFAPLSLVTVGGGQTIVADIQRQVVDSHHWLTATQFINDFAIARMSPGPGSLIVTLIGWQVAGLAGAIVATLAIFGPTTIMMLVVAQVWSRQQGRRWQLALQGGLRPVATGIILATVMILIESLDGGWLARAIAVVSTAVLMRTRVNPILLLAIGAGVFVALKTSGLVGA